MKMNHKVFFHFLIIGVLLFDLSGCASKKKSKKRFKSSSATMRSYCVLGKTYHPTYVAVGQKMQGISSWYGPDFHGKMTSNGETYNMHDRTAAHKTWPMNTMLRVSNMQNGKSTVVRVNDRGPFVAGRIVDCSYAAGKELGLDQMGIAKVQIEVVGFAGRVADPTKVGKAHERIALSNFGIQVGAFRRLEGAQIYKEQHGKIDPRYKTVVKHMHDEVGDPIYRVWMMGFASEEEARDFAACQNIPGAFIVRE